MSLESTFEEEHYCVISSNPEVDTPEQPVKRQAKRVIGKVAFGICEGFFLLLLGCSLAIDDIRNWWFWHSAKRHLTYWHNGEWITVVE